MTPGKPCGINSRLRLLAWSILAMSSLTACIKNDDLEAQDAKSNYFKSVGTPAENPSREPTGGAIIFKMSPPDAINGPLKNATFLAPDGIAVAESGEIFIADSDNQVIRKISRDGQVTTLAGLAGQWGNVDGKGASARFTIPEGIAVDKHGNVFVADNGNSTIRKITPEGVVTTVAGWAQKTPVGWYAHAGRADGQGVFAHFNSPKGLVVDGNGNIYVADSGNDNIRKISPSGMVTTIAGKSGMIVYGEEATGEEDGIGTSARFDGPEAIAIDRDGTLYVADCRNANIRKITADLHVSTVAGSKKRRGDLDGPAKIARFQCPTGVAIDPAGNLFVADHGNRSVRKITPDGVVSTIVRYVAKPLGDDDMNNHIFRRPHGIAIDGDGNLYVTDEEKNLIDKIYQSQGKQAVSETINPDH